MGRYIVVVEWNIPFWEIRISDAWIIISTEIRGCVERGDPLIARLPLGPIVVTDGAARIAIKYLTEFRWATNCGL